MSEINLACHQTLFRILNALTYPSDITPESLLNFGYKKKSITPNKFPSGSEIHHYQLSQNNIKINIIFIYLKNGDYKVSYISLKRSNGSFLALKNQIYSVKYDLYYQFRSVSSFSINNNTYYAILNTFKAEIEQTKDFSLIQFDLERKFEPSRMFYLYKKNLFTLDTVLNIFPELIYERNTFIYSLKEILNKDQLKVLSIYII